MEIEISTPYINLGQFLKLTDFISSGAEAKFMVKELTIFVNNEEENRRGRKLYKGDFITIEGKEFKIV